MTLCASQLGFNWVAVPAVNLAAFPTAFGSVAFLFFVHFTMPPIEAAMAEPDKFFNASLNAFAISTVITAIFGTIGAVRPAPNPMLALSLAHSATSGPLSPPCLTPASVAAATSPSLARGGVWAGGRVHPPSRVPPPVGATIHP
jgi:hypothetical protein